jgi:hypothetical protein
MIEVIILTTVLNLPKDYYPAAATALISLFFLLTSSYTDYKVTSRYYRNHYESASGYEMPHQLINSTTKNKLKNDRSKES